MSVEKVKFITISGSKDKLNEVASFCACSGVFHPDNAMSFYSDTKKVLPISTRNIYADYIDRLYSLLSSLSISPSDVDTEDFSLTDEEFSAFTQESEKRLTELIDNKNRAQKELSKYKSDVENSSHFPFDEADIEKLKQCEFVKLKSGKMPTSSFLKLKEIEDEQSFIFIPLSHDEQYYWGAYLTPVEFEDENDRTFEKLYFQKLEIIDIGDKQKQNETLKRLTDDYNKAVGELESFTSSVAPMLIRYYDKAHELYQTEKLKSHGILYKNNFVLIGWIPEENEARFTDGLKNIDDIKYTLSLGKDELMHDPPIKLKNSFFSRPFEFYVEMFGLPKYNEVDPSAFVAITYTILFGIMFGDLGQGIVLAVVGYLMWKLKNMKLGRLLVPCGISSAVFGLVYGSVFGFEHLLDPLYNSLGFEEKPIEVMESNTINYIIYAAVGIGVTLVVASMLLNVYTSLKQKNLQGAILGQNGIAGAVFYSALVFGLLETLILGNSVFTPVYIILLILLPLLLMYLQEPLGKLLSGKKNWQPEKWGEYLIQSFFELFETLLSYVSNTMSFLRVGAFVLVHAGMMMVVSILAGEDMGVKFILIQIFGNIFVIALEGLLVGIQVLRLEFYEMFSRFYTGSGRPFNPINIRLKKTNN